MTEQVAWKQMIVNKKVLAETLTQLNFQPTMFHIVDNGLTSVLVIYVDKITNNYKKETTA